MNGAEWIQYKFSAEDGFYRLAIHAEANGADATREEIIQIKLKDDDSIVFGNIIITQR